MNNATTTKKQWLFQCECTGHKGRFASVNTTPWKMTWMLIGCVGFTKVMLALYWFLISFFYTSNSLHETFPDTSPIPWNMSRKWLWKNCPKIVQHCPPKPHKTSPKHPRTIKNPSLIKGAVGINHHSCFDWMFQQKIGTWCLWYMDSSWWFSICLIFLFVPWNHPGLFLYCFSTCVYCFNNMIPRCLPICAQKCTIVLNISRAVIGISRQFINCSQHSLMFSIKFQKSMINSRCFPLKIA